MPYDPRKDRMDDFVGPQRTKATWKPRVCPDPITFYQCEECGAVMPLIDNADEIVCPGKGRDQISMLPIPALSEPPVCHGKPMKVLEYLPAEDVADRFELDYQIVGGVNMNTIKVKFWVKDKDVKPRWVYLKTFSGAQMKFITPIQKTPVLFALADLDAFTYCHDNPCHECVFRCKSGFEIYFYCENLGLVRMEMNRISQLDMKSTYENLR